MPARIAFLHTVADLDESFRAMTADRLPDAQVDAVVRPDLLASTLEHGRLLDETVAEVARLVHEAARDHDLVMVTCSTLGPAVDAVADEVEVPVLRVDTAMAQTAVDGHDRIGVLATLSTTLEPTTALLRHIARRLGQDPVIESVLCEGAFDAARAGRQDEHDAQVAGAIIDLASRVDVVVLAQASMAGALGPGVEVGVDVLTSPSLALDALARLVG